MYSFASTGDPNIDGMIDDHIIRSLYDRKAEQTGVISNEKKRSFFRRSSK
jgi:hypothetical protein